MRWIRLRRAGPCPALSVRRWDVDFGSLTLQIQTSSTTTVRLSSKVHIHVDGVLSHQHQETVSFDGIYCYARWLRGYGDEDVAGLDIELAGEKDNVGKGGVEVVLEFDAGTEDQATRLVVESVKVDLPASMSLRLELAQSKHSLLNTLLVNSVVLPSVV